MSPTAAATPAPAAAGLAPRPLLAIALLALAARLAFVLAFPFGGGDWDVYATVAENILRGCGVSLSDPAGPACVPHFGGNQGPGYPVFVALVWAASGHSDMAVRLVQTALAALAIAYLADAAARAAARPAVGVAAGLVLAASPLAVAWPRYTQTETLALAATIWVLAELLRSLAAGRLRIAALGAALIAATFIRLDAILLAVPVAVAALALHGVRQGLARGAAVALVLALPWAAWTARNLAVGLPRLTPTDMVMPADAPSPLGYLAWTRTWITKEYQRPGALWPINRFVYSAISIDPTAYDGPGEQARIEALLAGLARHDGAPIPAAIDDAFRAIAAERAARAPLRTWLANPLRRALALWSNPFSSFGWPNELPAGAASHAERLQIAEGGIAGKLALARAHPWRAATKALTGGYRYLLLVAFLAAALAAALWRGMDAPARRLAGCAAGFVVARTLVLAWIGNIETRYTAALAPAMEVAVVLVAAASLAAWQRRPRPRGA